MLCTSHHFELIRGFVNTSLESQNFFQVQLFFFQPLEKGIILGLAQKHKKHHEKKLYNIHIYFQKLCKRRDFATKVRSPLLFFQEKPITAAKFLRNADNRRYFDTKYQRFRVFLRRSAVIVENVLLFHGTSQVSVNLPLSQWLGERHICAPAHTRKKYEQKIDEHW